MEAWRGSCKYVGALEWRRGRAATMRLLIVCFQGIREYAWYDARGSVGLHATCLPPQRGCREKLAAMLVADRHQALEVS